VRTLSLTAILTAALALSAPAQILRVDSVSVDSVWNSDSSWNDGSSHQRVSRDCLVHFIPQGEGMARMFIAMSIDSGKTWAPKPDSLSVRYDAIGSPVATGRKTAITVRVLGGDRQGVAFMLTARQAGPKIAANPKIRPVGVTGALSAGQNVAAVLTVRYFEGPAVDGYCGL
jgi:hypothetical protein